MTNKVDRKLMNYQSGFPPLTMEKKLKNDWSLSDQLLPLIKPQELWLEENHLVVQTNIKYDDHSDINDLRTLHIAFMALSHALLNGYNTGGK